jgi:hypothetical protein
MVSEFNKPDEPPGENPDLEAMINNLFENFPDLTDNLQLGNEAIPTPEPPPSFNLEDVGETANFWHYRANNASPIDLPEKGSAALGLEGWVTIASEPDDDPAITVIPNGAVVSNDKELVTAIDPNDFAIAIRNTEKSVVGLIHVDGSLMNDERLNQQFMDDLDESISSINDLSPDNSPVQAVICGPATFPQQAFQEFSKEHPDFPLEEVGMDVVSYLHENSGQITELLANKFGENNVTTVLSGELQQVYIKPSGALEVDSFHSDSSEDYDTRIFLPDSLTPLVSSSDDPEPFTKLNNANVQYVVSLTQVETNKGERLEWLASPQGEFSRREDYQDYSVSFDINDSSIIEPEVTVNFNTGEHTVGSAKGVVDGRAIRITELPLPGQGRTPDGKVDVSLTLARQICNIGIRTGCDEVTIPASDLTSKPNSLQARFKNLVGKSDLPKSQQIINDKTAQKLGFRRRGDGLWHLSL